MLFYKMFIYDYMRIFGCLVMVINYDFGIDKFKLRGIFCVFLGYFLI